MDGSNWSRVLTDYIGCGRNEKVISEWRNLFIDRCDKYNGWTKMNGAYWANVLSELPELADKCNWDGFDAHDWYSLLMELPQFADKCDKWDEMDVEEKKKLIEKRPEVLQFIEKRS